MTSDPLFGDEPTGPTGWAIPLGWRADNQARCRSCSAEVMWCITPAGRRAPVDRDGTSHFATCPQGREWSRKGRAR